jgi:hypothetical protein
MACNRDLSEATRISFCASLYQGCFGCGTVPLERRARFLQRRSGMTADHRGRNIRPNTFSTLRFQILQRDVFLDIGSALELD